MDLETTFKRLGYPKHSGVIYKFLSDINYPVSVSSISKACGVSRVVVYRCLKKMLEDELVVENNFGKRTFYNSGSPHKLDKLIKLNVSNSLQLTKPLIKKHEKDVPKSVRFLYGKEGIREAFDDVISHTKKGDTFFRYTSEQDLDRVNKYLSSDYRQRRDKKKLERLVISNRVSGLQKKSRLERFVKFIPEDDKNFEQNVIQLVYGNRVAFIDLTIEEVMIIENKRLADFQKSIFKTLYRRLDR